MFALALSIGLAAAPDGKKEAADDWHEMSVLATYIGSGGVRYVRVAAGDLDGDGVDDEAVVKLDCDGAVLKSAHYVVSPRDSATGVASGKRMHKPFTIVKEWSAASPMVAKMRPAYDVKAMKGNEKRMASGDDDWAPITLTEADGMCAAPATSTMVKSKSNITNNNSYPTGGGF